MPNAATVFEYISNELGLGCPISQIKRVFGGYMHKMYCLETTNGKYAIKILNPEVMKRPDVFKNYETAERLEKVLSDNGLPIVPALLFYGAKIQCFNNQYFYVFQWIDGKALDSDEITKSHCAQIGELLAKLHSIEQRQEALNKNSLCIDWDSYIALANDKCPGVAAVLMDNRALLYARQQEGNLALAKVPAVTTICNGDMDSKNVLWVNGNPQIIDLECLSYGNPYMELFQLALCWSGYEHCHLNYELLKTFIQSYIENFENFQADWAALYSSNYGRLEWLEYNIKRALMIECENDEEQALGTEQVFETINHIIYYDSIRDELIHQLSSAFNG